MSALPTDFMIRQRGRHVLFDNFRGYSIIALMIIALVCLVASSAFAVSITDWTTYNEENGLREYLSDLNPAGFVIDYPVPEETVIGYSMYRVDVMSRNVSGWVFDQNESVPVLLHS